MSKTNVAALAVAGLIALYPAISIAGSPHSTTHSTTKTQPATVVVTPPSKGKPTTVVTPQSKEKTRRRGKISTARATAPRDSVRTMGDMTRYLENQGIPSVVAAGIVGNLNQESTLNPTAPGYGLAQWDPSRWASASAWISAHGQDPNASAGQLMYIAANVKNNVGAGGFYCGLKADLERAGNAQQAALVWMNDYEQPAGAGPAGTLSFTQGTACQAEHRQSFAVQAVRAE